jgi:acyl-coenzyme A thioesterase PaaI-like protein
VTLERIRSDANNCFVCGPSNPMGLQIEYRLDNDICRASFTPGANHVGYDNMAHGGILYSALDDVMANWLFLKGMRAHTAKCEIRYRKPVEIGTEILLEGRLLKRKGPVAIMEGKAMRSSDGEIIADAQGSFMIVPDED